MNKHLLICRNVRGLSMPAKAVLRILADRANERGESWPSMENIAEDLCSTRQTVNKSINELIKAKLICKSRKSKHNVYKFTGLFMNQSCKAPLHHDPSDVKLVTSDVKLVYTKQKKQQIKATEDVFFEYRFNKWKQRHPDDIIRICIENDWQDELAEITSSYYKEIREGYFEPISVTNERADRMKRERLGKQHELFKSKEATC